MKNIDITQYETLNKLRIDPIAEIEEAPAYCIIDNKPVFTAGNFSLIMGKKKAGKTFLLGGIIASAINNSVQLEVVKGCLPENQNVILYFDTEQSQYHATRSVKRICSLVGDNNPINLFAYGLRPLSPEERLFEIQTAIEMTPNLGIVAIDGIRDLLSRGINDEHEATKLTSLLLKWSYELNIHIVILLHQNKNDLNARGHIGSELVNKAETVISVTRDEKNTLFKVACEDSRDIPFDDFGFTITETGLPIASNIPIIKPRKKTNPTLISEEEHFKVLNELYSDKSEYNFGDLRESLMKRSEIGRDASEKFIKYYLDKGWLTSEQRSKFTYYRLNNNDTTIYYHPN